MGRLIGTTTQYSFLPGRTFPNSYTYDAASNRTSLTAPDGSTTAYQYDQLNRLGTLTNSLTGQFTFGYDALSRRTQLTRPNGINTGYAYDSVSHLLSVLHQAGSTVLDGAGYTYDPAGNRTSKTNYRNGITDGYSYDLLFQLTQVTQGTSTTESYSYDAVGNRLSSLAVPTYNYNASNQLTSSSAGSYTYDANGNTLTDAQGRSYTWDFENRLTQVVNPDVGTTTFKYDPFGRRIQKAGPLGTTNYLYDGPNLAEEVDNGGNILAKYTQGQGIDQPLSELRSGTISYYHPDGLGSVTSLSNSAASVANTYTYDSLGNLTGSTGAVTNPFRYTGREFDSETSLYYQRARYYDSTLGRFLSEDPYRFFAGSNFYAYVKNQSPNTLDAFGLVGSHPGSIDGAWNQARMLLSDPDCANFLKTLLESFNQAPDLNFFLHNFDNTNFGFTPPNDPFPNPDDYMAHVDVISGDSNVHVSRWAATPSNCCKVGVTLLHEVLHTIAYGWDDFQLATKVGYQGPNKVKPASRYFSKEMESHCVKACQK